MSDHCPVCTGGLLHSLMFNNRMLFRACGWCAAYMETVTYTRHNTYTTQTVACCFGDVSRTVQNDRWSLDLWWRVALGLAIIRWILLGELRD